MDVVVGVEVVVMGVMVVVDPLSPLTVGLGRAQDKAPRRSQALVRRDIKYIAAHSGRSAKINNDSNLMNVLLHHGSSFISDET